MHLLADRKGNIKKENSMQDRFLKAIYSCRSGRMLLKPLVSAKVSQFGGKLLDSRVSALFIPVFVRIHAIQMSDFRTKKYTSYNDFFKREMVPGVRNTDQRTDKLVSPCDGRLSVCKISGECVFTVKHTPYTVESLLRDRELAAEFAGGYVWMFRLCVEDYHRYIYADSGEICLRRRIPGIFHTVNPVANDFFPVYKENTREYCLINTENFGKMIQMEVGALLVGKIENRRTHRIVKRGQEKGNFAFGGSTVILITQKDEALPDGDILRYSKNGIETRVRLGEQVGRKMKRK